MAENKMIQTPNDRESLEYLVNLGRERTDIRTVVIGGNVYTPDNLRMIQKVYPPRPATFSAATLSGLVDYLLADVDKLHAKHPQYMVSVSSPTCVEVYSPIYGEEQRRDLVAKCVVQLPELLTDCYIDAEDFTVMVQTKVEQSNNRDLVLKFVGSMRDEQSDQVADDGFSQRVTIKTGVSQVGDVTVVNPVYLAPRRTFPEVQQPESPYILRLKEGPKAALYECDDHTWRVEAIASIGTWLCAQLVDDPSFVVIA